MCVENNSYKTMYPEIHYAVHIPPRCSLIIFAKTIYFPEIYIDINLCAEHHFTLNIFLLSEVGKEESEKTGGNKWNSFSSES